MHGEDGGACFKNCANDNGSGGIVPCICQLFNTLIPFRRFPGMPVNCDDDPNSRNCQEIDFCCPFSKLGFLISDSLTKLEWQLTTETKQIGQYVCMKAVATKKIYSFSTKRGKTGGVIYYELAQNRPDLVLKDIVKILHPEVLPNHELYFFEQLK